MLGVLFAVWIMPGLRRSRETESCPARGCPFVGPPRSLTVHWRSFHEEMVVLYMCPLPECSWQTFKPQNLRQHWENYHHAAKHQSLALRTLPLLAEFVRNRHRTDPGDCRPPVLPVQRPMGSLPHDCKGSLLVQVQRILNDPGTPTPGTSSLVAPPSQPVPLPIVSRAMPRCDQNPSAGPSSLVVPSRTFTRHAPSTTQWGPEGGGRGNTIPGGWSPGEWVKFVAIRHPSHTDPETSDPNSFSRTLTHSHRHFTIIHSRGFPCRFTSIHSPFYPYVVSDAV